MSALLAPPQLGSAAVNTVSDLRVSVTSCPMQPDTVMLACSDSGALKRSRNVRSTLAGRYDVTGGVCAITGADHTSTVAALVDQPMSLCNLKSSAPTADCSAAGTQKYP